MSVTVRIVSSVRGRILFVDCDNSLLVCLDEGLKSQSKFFSVMSKRSNVFLGSEIIMGSNPVDNFVTKTCPYNT